MKYVTNLGIVLFTLLLKTLAVLSLLILSIFEASDSLIFIIALILNVFYFCFEKNASGLLPFCLKYWKEIKVIRTEIWLFESDNEKRAQVLTFLFFWKIYLVLGNIFNY